LISGQKPMVAFNARKDFDVFTRKPKAPQRRQGMWSRM
jgi:hypothetical protein